MRAILRYIKLIMIKYKVNEAVKNFDAGNYQEALTGFLAAAEVYGEKFFAYNIRVCKQRLVNSKTAPGSEANHFLNQYFDHVYLVNLPHHAKKRLQSVVQLSKSGIEFELYNATNGYVGVPREAYDTYLQRGLGNLNRYPEFNEREVKRAKPFIESPGAMGYIYTYLSILKDAKINGYRRFLILEDDVVLCRDFEHRLREFIASVGDDWKVLQLGASQYGWGTFNEAGADAAGYYYPRSLDTCGSFAIAFHHSIIDEVIAAESAFDAPFDHLPMGEIYERHLKKCFVAYPNIVMPDVTESSIREKRCQSTHALKMKWVMQDFDFPIKKPSMAVFLSSKENATYIPMFADIANFPIDLRVYYNTQDGPRPVHNFGSFHLSKEPLQSAPSDTQFIDTDFCATVDSDIRITDRDLVSYIEKITGVNPNIQTPLSKLSHQKFDGVTERVSVIIPTYKRPDNLRVAVTSVLSQDYKDIEVIVISDNGQDSEFNAETREIIDSLRVKFPDRNIIFIEHSINRNGAAARNTGIFKSTGEYICFLDDDDIFLEGRITKSVDRLKSTSNNIGAVYCGFLGWNSPSNDGLRYPEGNLSLQILQLDYKKHYLHTNTATYKRSAVLSINGFDESYRRHQDLEFNLRFFDHFEMCSVKEALVRLNPAPSQVSNKIFNRSLLDLKIKFLGQFDKKISAFGEDIAREIYLKHWNEVVRYIHNYQEFLSEISRDYRNGSIATIAFLEAEQIKKTSSAPGKNISQ